MNEKTKNNNPEKGEERKEEEKKIGVGKNDGKKGKKRWTKDDDDDDGKGAMAAFRVSVTPAAILYIYSLLFFLSFLFNFYKRKKSDRDDERADAHEKTLRITKKDDRCCLYFFVFRLDCTAYRLRCLTNKIFPRLI